MATTPIDLKRHAGGLNVQLVHPAKPQSKTAWRLPTVSVLSFRRRLSAWVILVVGLPLLLMLLTVMRPHLRVDAALLITLAMTMAVAALGGFAPGVTASVLGAAAVNWGFVPPYGTLDVHDPADAVSVSVFVLVGVVVATLVGRVARGSAEAVRARNDAEALSCMATLVATEVDPLPSLLEAACDALEMNAAALFERCPDGRWKKMTTAGMSPPSDIADGFAHPVDSSAVRVLVLHGRALNSNDAGLLDGIANQITVALDALALRREAAEAEIVSRADQLRTSILQAVSHDLRSPLTAIKASVTTMLSDEVTLEVGDTIKLLATIDCEVDRLNRVVGNLLDMSRLQAGVLPLDVEPIPISELINSAAESIGMQACSWQMVIDPAAATALVDGALMERAIANVMANAARVQPLGQPIQVTVLSDAEAGVIRVVILDSGPGIPADRREQSLMPFQRLGDSRSHHGGVGLGLAIADGLTRANNGELTLGDSPGGGLSVELVVPIAADPEPEDR
ncbi:MAG: DUF4118 domain-containing protein [Microthrixaceae bacterium]|nr:DUF4118 domain-containing protein [Microthrixaceae bacterium]